MARPEELARLVPFDIPAVDVTVTDLRDHDQRQQKLIRREWVKQISISLRHRDMVPDELLCTSSSFGKKHDKEILEFERRRAVGEPNLVFKDFKDNGGAVTRPQDIDPRERQSFYALHDTKTGDIVGGITIMNIRIVRPSVGVLNLSAIILPGAPPLNGLVRLDTALEIFKELMNVPHSLVGGETVNFVEWRLMPGGMTRTDPSSIVLLERLSEEFDIFTSKNEPGVGLVRRRS